MKKQMRLGEDPIMKKDIKELSHEQNRYFNKHLNTIRISNQDILGINESFQGQKDHKQQYNNSQREDDEIENITEYNKKQYAQSKLHNILKILKLRMIVSKIINSTPSRMLKLLTNAQYAYINDKSQHFQDDLGFKNAISSKSKGKYQLYKGFIFIIKPVIKIVGYIPIINPSVLLKQLWDLCVSLVLLYSFLIIPIKVCYSMDENAISQYYSSQLIIWLIIIDIFIQCNTGFYKHGILCKNRVMIWNRYHQEQLTTDIFSLLPLIFYQVLNYFQDDSKVYQFLTLSILIKWKTIVKYYTHIQQNYILKSQIRNTLRLLNLFFQIFLIAHVCACIWIVTGRISQVTFGASWMKSQNVLEEPWYTSYILAFYFCTVTMATVGYGDVVPQSPLEIIITIIMVLFACGVFGFSVNTINDILKDFFEEENKIMEKMSIIKNYLKKKSINQYLQRDVTEYLEQPISNLAFISTFIFHQSLSYIQFFESISVFNKYSFHY